MSKPICPFCGSPKFWVYLPSTPENKILARQATNIKLSSFMHIRKPLKCQECKKRFTYDKLPKSS